MGEDDLTVAIYLRYREANSLLDFIAAYGDPDDEHVIAAIKPGYWIEHQETDEEIWDVQVF